MKLTEADLDRAQQERMTPGGAVIDTTRRYPRTLYGAEGAFPQDARFGSSITYVGPKRLDRMIDAAWWAIGWGLVGALVWLAMRFA